MAVYKDGNKWRVIYRYTNWKGEKKQTQKTWFCNEKRSSSMGKRNYAETANKVRYDFCQLFSRFMSKIRKKIKRKHLGIQKPYHSYKKYCPTLEIERLQKLKQKDVIAWQNKLMAEEKYSPTYLKTIHSQLSAIFNHAVRFYHLPYNPAQRAGTIGSEEHKEMLFLDKRGIY